MGEAKSAARYEAIKNEGILGNFAAPNVDTYIVAGTGFPTVTTVVRIEKSRKCAVLTTLSDSFLTKSVLTLLPRLAGAIDILGPFQGII